jgi:iron complex outermembrane receptor protein
MITRPLPSITHGLPLFSSSASSNAARLSRASALLPACVLAFASVPAAAQQPKDTARTLPTVTSTATRNAAPILTTPLAVNKITSERLRSTSGYGLEDALRDVPGVIAQTRYGTSDLRLIIRGFGARGAGDRSNSGTSRGVRVLLDGFPETEPDGRTAFDHIDLATAEQVEVIRSNASSLWGNAAGGVINVMSVPQLPGVSFDMQPIVGAFGLKRLAVRSQAVLGRTGSMWVGLTNSTFDGWRKHSDARRVLLNAGATGNVGDHSRLGVYLVAANNLMHIPGPLTLAEYEADPTQANATYLARDERRYNRQGRVGLTLDHELGQSTSISSMFYVNPKFLQRSERGTFRDFTRYHIGGNVVGRSTVTLGEMTHRLMLGFDEAYQDGSIQFYTLVNNERGALTDNKGEGAQNIGVFVQDEFTTLNDRLTLLLGGRYDRVAYNYRTFFDPNAALKKQTKDFDRLSPKVGVSFRTGALGAVYANLGGGIEVPAGNETDQPPTAGSAGPVPGALLNPLLEAISSTTVELGYKVLGWSLAGGAATIGGDVAVYSTDVTNEIIPYSGGRYYQTAASAKRNGLEVGLNAVTHVGLFANAALTFNDHTYEKYVVDSSVINSTNRGRADLSGNQVMGVPKMFGTADIGTEIPGYRNLRLSAGIEHSGEYFADDKNTITVPSYTIFNLTAALRSPIIARSGVALRGFVQVRNLTDKTYVGSAFLNPDLNSAGQPMVYEPGAARSVTVSLSLGYR